MPNGGSDCCGTCWFNAKNKGEAGYQHASDPGTAFCIIRDLEIRNPFYTYCANHPHRCPNRDPIPIGPVYTGDSSGERKVWMCSPDSEEIRQHLLFLLGEIVEQPRSEYPIGIYADEAVVWQLGEFREQRAVKHLQRILQFQPEAAESGPFGRTRKYLIHLSRDALGKIERD